MNPSHLFLDVDGVLNNNKTPTHLGQWFDPDNLANFLTLHSLLGEPAVVLSSDWRKSILNTKLVKRAIYPIRINSKTPILMSEDRSEEIRSWLYENAWTRAIILDDLPSTSVDPEMDRVHFFKIDSSTGLSKENVDFVLEYLSENN
jgi:hypothetical protein